MSVSVETTSNLHDDYVLESAAVLADLQRALSRLEREPGDGAAMTELMRGFHGFAGSGATFGFPEQSATGAAGERLTLRLLAAGIPLDPAELLQLAALLADLERQLAAGGHAGALRTAAGEASAAAGPVTGERSRGEVLVAAAEATQRGLVPLLRLGGFAVRAVGGATEALAAMAAGMPDLVVVESELPDGCGYRLTAALRQLPGGGEPAVLMLGPVAGTCDRSAAIYCGADAALDRPIDWCELARNLAQLQAGRAEAARVLAVEDDPRHAAYVRDVLEGEGYEVCCCADPGQFAATLATFRPHLVLMDVLLPGLTGYELVRTLRGDELNAGLPVLFLTTEGQIGARIESVRAGGDDHLVKPVPSPLLVSAVAARIERSRRVQNLLETDGLTRLLHQSAFIARAQHLAASRETARQPVWVMIDLDHFKSVNDRYGHPAGDRVLATAARFLRGHVRARDVVGRYGGEELGLLFADLPASDAMRLVDRLRREFSQLEFTAPNDASFNVTWSAGVALLGPGKSWEEWREAADQALYAAKRGGRNRVELAAEPARERRQPAACRIPVPVFPPAWAAAAGLAR